MSSDPHIAARAELLHGLAVAAVEAGAVIMAIRAEGFDVAAKADASPVTAADHAAEAILLDALRRLAPDVPVVAEEESAAGRTPQVRARFFLVDPLDGTKEFVKGGTDFTVNVGLVEDGAPTLGVVYAPARDELYLGDVAAGEARFARPGEGETGRAIRVRPPGSPLVAVASKSHDVPETEAYLRRLGVVERTSIGSSLKFCLLAAGQADVYPRPSPTCEWDTAAGHAVLAAAGGAVYDLQGGPLGYGKPRFFNPGFLALGALRGLPPLAG
jgi:3'(2'), 5'-bisphosphate nucleotidase